MARPTRARPLSTLERELSIPFATPVLRPSLDTLVRIDPISRTILREIEDRRAYHPDRYRPAIAVPTSSRHLTLSSNLHGSLPWHVAFSEPRNVVVCVRRKSRREVLFALNRTGKGAQKKRRRRNSHSSTRC